MSVFKWVKVMVVWLGWVCGFIKAGEVEWELRLRKRKVKMEVCGGGRVMGGRGEV